MRGRNAIALLLGLSFAASAGAGITVTPDRRTVGVKEAFYLIVRAEGGRIGEPVLPHAEGLVIQRRPASTRQQTSVNFINGRVQQNNVREWHYEAWGTQIGSIEIPPIKITIDGAEELSKPVTIEVSDAAAPLPQGARPTPPQPPGQQRQPNQPQQQPRANVREQVQVDDLVKITATLSKTEVYEGEAAKLEVRFARLDDPSVIVRGDQGNSIVIPSIEGFYESEIQRDERVETIAGYDYVVTTFSRAVFATRAGDIEIPSVTWTGRVTAPSPLGPRSYRVERITDPITVTVKPLPTRPPEFNGAVGRFNISGELEGGVVEQGKPKVYTVTIAGQGNVDAIAKPALPAMDWCHVSEPEVSVEPLAGALEFEKKFAYTLTPTQVEMHQIPPMPFCFFAPELGSYKTVSTKPLDVYVQPAQDEGQLVVVGGRAAPAQNSVAILNTDIAPLITESRGLAPAGNTLPANAVGFTAPPLAFLACLAYVRRQRRLATDTGFARGIRARSRSQKRIQTAASSKDPGEALFKALTGFVGDKLNLPDAGLTSHDVRGVMEKHGFSESLVEEYVKVLRTCERQRYSGESLGAAEVTALTEAAFAALEHLERETRGGGR